MSDLLELPNLMGGLDHPELPISNVFTALRSMHAAFITGLQLERASATSIKVKKGVAALESGGFVQVTADLTISPTLGASTWYHVYLYVSSEVATIEAVTTAPASPYFATARSKTGVNSRRYVGSFKTNASSQIYRFYHNPVTNQVKYLEQTDTAPFRVLSAGASTTLANIAASGIVPVTSQLANLSFITGTQIASIGNPDDVGTFILQLIPSNHATAELPLDSSQRLRYLVVAGGSLYVDVLGYVFER
jgi:hypothetical protein